MTKWTIPFLLMMLLTGCSMTPEERAAYDAEKSRRAEALSKVAIANSLTATEATQFQELKTVECAADSSYAILTSNQSAEDQCRNKLKEIAVNAGADLIIIESADNFKCDSASGSGSSSSINVKAGTKFDCIKMKSRLYKKRSV